MVKGLVLPKILIANDNDKFIEVFTKELGLVKAKVIGAVKPTSKLISHFNPLNLVQVRLIRKNQFLVTDAVTIDTFPEIRRDFSKLKEVYKVLKLIQETTPMIMPDLPLWYFLVRGLRSGRIDLVKALAAIGYDPEQASCGFCGEKTVASFFLPDQNFICQQCAQKIKIKDNHLIRI